MTLRADDRVLLLDIPADEAVAAMARILSHGVLVALGSPESVESARATFAEFDNVMFLSASPQQIPWRDAYFTHIFVPQHLAPLLRAASTELTRVLAPGGTITPDEISV